MKKWFTISAVLLLIVGVGAWYFLKDSDNQRTVVPDDATAVMVLNTKELVEEIGVSKENLQNVDNKTGIDFSEKIYGFVTAEGYIGLSAAISDEDDLEKNMTDITSLRGMTWGMTGSWLTCFDDMKVVFIGPLASMKDDDLKDLVARLMMKKMVNSDLMDSVEHQASPLSLRISLNALPKSLQESIAPNLPKALNLAAAQLVINSKASDKDIVFESSIASADPKINELYNDWLSSLKPMTGNLVKQCPQDPVIWLGMGANGETVLEQLRKISKLRTMLLGLNLCIDADLMLKAIDGDVAVSVPMLTAHTQTFQVLAELKDSRFLAGAPDWSSKSSALQLDKLGGDKFLITTPATQIYFGVKDNNLLYIANDNTLTNPENFLSVGGNLSQLQSKVKGSKMFVSVNLSKVLNTAAPLLMALGYSQAFYDTLDELDRLNIRVADDNQTMEITFKEPIGDIVNKWIK